MSIKTIIKNFAESITVGRASLSFFHGEKDWQNMTSDEGTLPACYLDEPIAANWLLHTSGHIDKRYPLSMIFMLDSDLDWAPEQHDNVIQVAYNFAQSMIKKLNNSQEIKEVTHIKTVEFINMFDRNGSGVILYVTVLPYSFDPSC